MTLQHFIAFAAASATYTGPVLLADAIINEQSLIPLGAGVVISVFIGGVLLRVGRILQRIDDKLDAQDKELAKQDEMLLKIQERINHIEGNCNARHPQYRPDDPKRLP